jgi:PAS domain S-box-containing protein
MNARAPTDAETSLLSLPPTHRQTRWAIAVAVCQVAAFALVAPFARTQLAEINAFIPAFEGVIFVTDLVTSVLLFLQFAIYRLRALLVLACGYLFSALMIIPHALTFPGAFSPTGLLGAGLQTTASLYWFWHLLFPMALLGYGLLRNEKSDPGPDEPSLLAVVVGSVALVLTLACGLTLLATAGNNYLLVLFADRVGFTPEARLAAATTMLLSVSAVAVLWLRRRSLLDQWLIIVALGALLEMALGAMFVSGRFSLGFYAGRLFSLLTSTIVLVVLLVETMRFHANVARSKERKIRRLVDANILGICISNLEGAIIEANEAFLRMLQYSREDVVSRRLRWTDLTPAEWREQNERSVAELHLTGAFHPVEKEYFRKDGNRVPVLVGGALFEKSGNEGVIFALDLTERKRAEDTLRRSEAWLAQAQKLSRTGTWVMNGTTRRFLYWSDESYRIWGFDPQQGLPSREDMWGRIHPDDRERLWEEVQEALREQRDFFEEFRILLPDGRVKYLEANTHHEFSPLGELLEVVCTSVDVTERKRARDEHEQLLQLEADLAHMNRLSMMGELAASLAHEIKQPITAARNNAGAAVRFLDRSPPELEEVREALACIVDNADRAGDIIDRIRDHIKKAPLRKKRFDLSEAINEVIELARSAIADNRVSVQTRLAEESLPIHGDRVQLQQVLLNLILNAVEAMGSVEAGSRELLVSTEQDHTGVLVDVRDSGPGIDATHLERVFEAFYTTKSGGTGMGLSICRSIIEAHGGRLWAEANEPRGAVFQFTLPGAERELDGNANTVTAAGARTDCPAGSGL